MDGMTWEVSEDRLPLQWLRLRQFNLHNKTTSMPLHKEFSSRVNLFNHKAKFNHNAGISLLHSSPPHSNRLKEE
jgi:hypothetical protein